MDRPYTENLDKAIVLATGAAAGGSGPNFGVATASFAVDAAAGKSVRYGGYIRTEGVKNGYAGLWWRVDGKSGVLAFDNMGDRGVTGTTGWKHYEIELPVAADATSINFGALLMGDGTAWFDGLTIDLDGRPYLDKSAFDLDFESSTPRGFFTGGNGYRVLLDNEVFHDGKQSLRMHREPGAQKPAGDPKGAAQAWKDVVLHLESSREAYRVAGAASKDIEWAIQSARVVLQGMQMRSGEVTRDQSMAENIKWIADQNPGARIVVWAHNGHVSTASPGGGGNGPMGTFLRKMFGDKMVVFGFSFNQGSFQSMSPGKGLRDFTVPPAPAGSLDGTLAATGIPLFVLDLRQAPRTGPITEWLNAPHQTRSIGAGYDGSEFGYMFDMRPAASFDALIFVEKTTAARRNPSLTE